MAHTLYLIGNGFDLHHRMKTRYSEFYRFVRATNPNVFFRIERYLPLYENWFNLEAALGSIDADHITEDASQFLMSYGAENWSDSGHHDYQYEIEQSVAAISSELLDLLQKWIFEVELPVVGNPEISFFTFEENSKFLNFNYTQTLEATYGQSPDKILHIHGSVSGEPSDPILGHSCNPEEITPEWLSYSDENMDTRVIEGNEILKPCFEETFKPTDRIIETNILWFQALASIESIYVFGHSLSEVDSSYFYEICKHINTNNVVWHVSYYSAQELPSHMKFMSALGINSSLVEYNELADYARR